MFYKLRQEEVPPSPMNVIVGSITMQTVCRLYAQFGRT